MPGIEQELRAVLAGVAGPADEHRDAGQGALAAVHARGQRPVGEAVQHRARFRALDREHRVVRQPVDHIDVEVRGMALKPRQVTLVVGGIGDRQEVALGEPVGEQVVEHAAALVAEHAVLGTALGQPADVVGQQQLQQRRGTGPASLDLSHVRDVEHPGVAAHGHVLGLDARVLKRHLPAGEGHEPGPGGAMAFVQRGAAKGLGGDGRHPHQAIAGPSRPGLAASGPSGTTGCRCRRR